MVELSCEGGKIGRYDQYFIAAPPQGGKSADYDEESVCTLNFEGLKKNYDNFDRFCLDKSACKVGFEVERLLILSECMDKQDKTLQDFDDYELFFRHECDYSQVNLPYFGQVSKKELANIVIVCDALICMIFAANIYWLSHKIQRE